MRNNSPVDYPNCPYNTNKPIKDLVLRSSSDTAKV